jgi:putative ABC transport system ATP-binding protein
MIDGRAVIQLDNVYKTYGSGETAVHALRAVTMTVRQGEFVAIMGPSGSGKSTLMNIIGCLDVPSMGRYHFAGEDVSRMTDASLARVRNERIGFVFQQFHLLKRMSAWRNVELPLLYRRVRGRKEKAIRALGMVGLDHRVNHLPNELSGGQQQRVAIARALVTDPELLLADEPTGNLDTHSSAEILEILRSLHRTGRTIVLITHDPEIASTAERVVSIRDGELSEGAALPIAHLTGEAVATVVEARPRRTRRPRATVADAVVDAAAGAPAVSAAPARRRPASTRRSRTAAAADLPAADPSTEQSTDAPAPAPRPRRPRSRPE